MSRNGARSAWRATCGCRAQVMVVELAPGDLAPERGRVRRRARPGARGRGRSARRCTCRTAGTPTGARWRRSPAGPGAVSYRSACPSRRNDTSAARAAAGPAGRGLAPVPSTSSPSEPRVGPSSALGAGRCRGQGDDRPDPEERGEDLIAGPGRSGDVLEPGDEIALVFEDVDAALRSVRRRPARPGRGRTGRSPGSRPPHRRPPGRRSGQHPGRVAGADHQGPAAVAQLGVERLQAGPQECAPRRCPMVPPPSSTGSAIHTQTTGPRAAAPASAGWSSTRRSRRNQTTVAGAGIACQSAGPGAEAQLPSAAGAARVGCSDRGDLRASRPVTPDEHIAPWPFRVVSRLRDPVQEFLATESAGGIVLAAAATRRDSAGRRSPPRPTRRSGPSTCPRGAAARSPHLTPRGDRPRRPDADLLLRGRSRDQAGADRRRAVGRARGAGPGVAAVGGMVVPALVYVAITHGGAGGGGWGSRWRPTSRSWSGRCSCSARAFRRS